MKQRQTFESEIINDLANFVYSPLDFVKYIFSWGEKGTILENEDIESPCEVWVTDVFKYIQRCLVNGVNPIRIAIRAGHSCGKTCMLAHLILWYMCTRVNPQIVVTANTRAQLISKTWRELAKWHKLSIVHDWFEWTATQFFKKNSKSTWCANALAWSKESPESFAGTHENNVLIIFDEASAIDNVIWDVTEGAMGYGECIWVVVGNPSRTSGKFYDCFSINSEYSKLWKTYEVDSRTCKHSNKQVLKSWIDCYGEDSDFVRVRVLGKPPKHGINQLITEDMIKKAVKRTFEPSAFTGLPVVMGVDVARYGNDKSSIAIRQGQNFIFLETLALYNTTELVEYLIRVFIRFKVNLCFIDLGYNPGVYDLLIKVCKQNVAIHGVNFGGRNTMDDNDKAVFANCGAMMYYRLREHLENGGNIPNNAELLDELVSREYFYNAKGQIMLESKDDVRRRLGRSTDKADSCALTFANTTLELSQFNNFDHREINNELPQEVKSYNPFDFM